MIWNPVDLSGRPKCFRGMFNAPACPATATRYRYDAEQSIFLFLCDAHAEEHIDTLPIATALGSSVSTEPLAPPPDPQVASMAGEAPDLTALRELVAKATGLPWRDGGAISDFGNSYRFFVDTAEGGGLGHFWDARARDLAIAAVNALSGLLDRIGEACEEIALDDKLIAERDRVLDALLCPEHGRCVPYAIEMISAWKADLASPTSRGPAAPPDPALPGLLARLEAAEEHVTLLSDSLAAQGAELTQVRERLAGEERAGYDLADEAKVWQRRALDLSQAVIAIDNADSVCMEAGIADALEAARNTALSKAYNDYDQCLQDAVTLADYARSPIRLSAGTEPLATPPKTCPPHTFTEHFGGQRCMDCGVAAPAGEEQT